MNFGKARRMSKIFRKSSSRTIILPLDHGLTIGAVLGIENIAKTTKDLSIGYVDAMVMHKGLVSHSGLCDKFQEVGLMVHLSASTDLSPCKYNKSIVCTVEEAIKLGADGVSIHINIGNEYEDKMLSDAGKIAAECEHYGLPLLMMVYGRGPKIKDEFSIDVISHCARIGMELGADIVKVPYSGDVESFTKVVNSCNIPVLIAGGNKLSNVRELLSNVANSLLAGGAGISIGRNVFQYPNRVKLAKALEDLVHNGKSLEYVLKEYNF